MKKEMYITKDIGEAATLYCLEKEFLGVSRQSNVFWFMFDGKEDCEEVSQAFWAKKLRLDPWAFLQSSKAMKDIIFMHGSKERKQMVKYNFKDQI